MAIYEVSLVDGSRLQLFYAFASHRTSGPLSLIRVTLEALDGALALPVIFLKVAHVAAIAKVKDAVALSLSFHERSLIFSIVVLISPDPVDFIIYECAF